MSINCGLSPVRCSQLNLTQLLIDCDSLFRLSDYSSEVWIYTLQTSLEVHRNMFGHKSRAILGLIFFTVLIQRSEKQWKVLSVV